MEVGRLGQRFNEFETTPVMERRNSAACRDDLGWVDLCHDHARLGAALGQNAAPRVDDERMAVCLAAVFVLAALGGGEHEAAIFDGTCALQNMPVCFAGLPRES